MRALAFSWLKCRFLEGIDQIPFPTESDPPRELCPVKEFANDDSRHSVTKQSASTAAREFAANDPDRVLRNRESLQTVILGIKHMQIPIRIHDQRPRLIKLTRIMSCLAKTS